MSESVSQLCRKRECFQGAGRTGLCTEHLQDTLNTYSLPQLIDMAVETLETRGFPDPSELRASTDPMLN